MGDREPERGGSHAHPRCRNPSPARWRERDSCVLNYPLTSDHTALHTSAFVPGCKTGYQQPTKRTPPAGTPKTPMKIRKAVFPVAGLGTRVLPATKAMPKEMLTIVDKPLIQYVYDEAREAGIEHFIFVTGRNKSVIEDHFDKMFELDATLSQRGKKAEQE